MPQLLIGILATWRLSHLLLSEDAPFQLASRLRFWAGVYYDEHSNATADNELGKLFTCVFCLSVWVGWLVALATGRKNWFWRGMAYSAGAIWLERFFNAD